MASTTVAAMGGFPTELEQEIFELAARACPGSAPVFALVARKVQYWVERVIYSSVVLGLPAARTELFLRTMRSRPNAFFAERVRRVYLTGVVTPAQAKAVLSVCIGARTLVCWTKEHERIRHTLGMGLGMNHSGSALLGLVSSAKTIQRLSVRADAIWDVRIGQPDFMRCSGLFSRITHLDIVNPPASLRSTGQLWSESGIYELLRLECLSIGNLDRVYHVDYVDILKDVLRHCPRLRMLVVLSTDSSLWEEEIEDERFAAVTRFNHEKRLIDYWEDVRGGGKDFWDLCEALMGERRSTKRRRLIEDP